MIKKEAYFNSLKKISGVDGRHCLITLPLSDYFSEHALHKYRTLVELKHLIKMCEPEFGLPNLTEEDKKELMAIFENFDIDNASFAIAEYDHFGRNGIGPVEHDVKSVELYIGEKLKGTKYESLLSMVHFGFTSEDVSNIAYNCMLQGAYQNVWLPQLIRLCDKLKQLALENKDVPLLSRTHGQPASPTTFGKEIGVYLGRFTNQLEYLSSLKLSSKMNGAVGNYNAQKVGFPNIDWVKYSKEFVESFGFDCEFLTNQRGPKDRIVKMFQSILNVNIILKDLNQDFWYYVSKDLVLQKKVESHVGSSVMPHKINPWLIECSEGNVEVSNALFEVFARELEVSRLQRDLSDHDMERNYGAAFGYSLVALSYTNDFLELIYINGTLMLNELKENQKVLSEAYQTIFRAKGRSDGYNVFKDIFRSNESYDPLKIDRIINALDVDDETKQQLRQVKCDNYLGYANELVEMAVKKYDNLRSTKN